MGSPKIYFWSLLFIKSNDIKAFFDIFWRGLTLFSIPVLVFGFIF